MMNLTQHQLGFLICLAFAGGELIGILCCYDYVWGWRSRGADEFKMTLLAADGTIESEVTVSSADLLKAHRERVCGAWCAHCYDEATHPRQTAVKYWFSNVWTALKTFKISWQSGSFGPDPNISWTWDTRRMHFFHSYMGWSNLSETHRSDQCQDAAYCQWHGML